MVPIRVLSSLKSRDDGEDTIIEELTWVERKTSSNASQVWVLQAPARGHTCRFNGKSALLFSWRTGRSVSGQNHPTEPDYLAISKLARATITNAKLNLNNKALFTCVILQYSAVYFNRILSLFTTTRALGLRGPNSKCASFTGLMRVYRSSLSRSL